MVVQRRKLYPPALIEHGIGREVDPLVTELVEQCVEPIGFYQLAQLLTELESSDHFPDVFGKAVETGFEIRLLRLGSTAREAD